jgi:hypothetical protein
MNSMQKAKAKLAQAWEDNPLAVVAVGAFTATAASKLINSLAAVNNSRAWSKEVNRRSKKTNSRR